MMNPLRTVTIALSVAMMFLMFEVYQACAIGPKVSEPGNKHNLSGPNTTVTYRATNDPTNNPRGQQICIFCHTPHSANVVGQAPLWNRAFSAQTFQRYTSTTLHIRHIANAQYDVGAQPNGSSRLCLSCHDGVSRLGAVYNGPEITMSGSNVITGLSSFNAASKMLSGHHPVSFVYLTGFNNGSQSGVAHPQLPTSYRFIPISTAGKVKLFDTNRSSNGWMQCTTCHDPHQNQSDENACYDGGGVVGVCGGSFTRKVAPFWIYKGVPATTATQDAGTVCKVCHALGAPAGPQWP